MLKITILVLIGLMVAVASCQDWESFKSTHKKSYPNAMEETRRRELFESRVRKIEEHNANEKYTFKMGVNHMTDWTEEEIQTLMGFKARKGVAAVPENSVEASQYLETLASNLNGVVPDQIDWREVKNVVTPVKNQLQCGSCWAFATTGVLEGQQRRLKNQTLISLSEQNLVDCSTENSGCNGGLMSEALKFVRLQGGIDSAMAYPYRGVDGKCQFKKNAVAMKAIGSAIIGPNDEELLKMVVASYGPVSVGIVATDKLVSYEAGVFDDSRCGEDLNHGVLIVGYGTNSEDGDFWIVKNSWGKAWGEKGYVRMSRNKGNQCGIASEPTIALV